MVEVKHRITVVRDDGVAKHDGADGAPIGDRAPNAEGGAADGALIGGLDRERQHAFRHRVAAIEYLRHHLVAKIEIAR
jgi:hypothetical protein